MVRYVREANGHWEVLEEGAKRGTTRADTEAKAVAQARRIVKRHGGGEVRIVNQAGKIVTSAQVSRVRRNRRAG